MAIEIRYVDAPLGHQIGGVDLSKHLAEDDFREIEAAFDRYGVIVFRGQILTPEGQVDFSRRFGELEVFALSEFNHPTMSEILVVSNIVEDGRQIGMADAGRYWHSDMWYTAHPPRGSMLYALEVPTDGKQVFGDTMFASMSAAYDALPDRTKKLLEGRLATFSYARYLDHKRATLTTESRQGETAQGAREKYWFDDIQHPIVRIHPRSGRKCLYLSQGVISEISGLDRQQSEALVAELEAHVVKPEFVYRHKWRVGDVVMWDNCAAIHRAVADYSLPFRRHMHRTTIAESSAGPQAA
ncbi:MAG: TauD/TfdA family dioxygenase [Azospirillaceae bacterium]